MEAFEGSVYHFLRSFCSKTLANEGFDIYRVDRAGRKIPRSQWRTRIIEYSEFIEPGIYPKESKLHFKNFLHVVYDNNLVSWIGLNYSNITLDEFGNPHEDSPYVIYGEWSKFGIANILPKNYLL